MPRHNEDILSFAALQNQMVVTGQLEAVTAIRIGAGRASDVTGNDLPVLRDARNRPFIPGASLKGAFRARIETLVRTVAPEQALDLQELEVWQEKQIMPLKEDEDLNDDLKLSNAIWEHSTLIDKTFGAPWLAGRIFFKDAHVIPEYWFDQHETRNGVAINRDTETAEEGLLYDYEVTPAGTRFDFELVLENADQWQRGMVLLALRQWQRHGEVAIGGFRSRGLGRVQLHMQRPRFVQLDGNDAIDTVIALLNNGAKEAGREVSDADEQAWIKSFSRHLGAIGKTGA